MKNLPAGLQDADPVNLDHDALQTFLAQAEATVLAQLAHLYIEGKQP